MEKNKNEAAYGKKTEQSLECSGPRYFNNELLKNAYCIRSRENGQSSCSSFYFSHHQKSDDIAKVYRETERKMFRLNLLK